MDGASAGEIDAIFPGLGAVFRELSIQGTRPLPREYWVHGATDTTRLATL